MSVLGKSSILQFLTEADIEGLIAAGAPVDEYEEEAEAIFLALESVEPQLLSDDAVIAIVSSVWAESFGLDAHSLKQRRGAFEAVAKKIQGI